MKRLSGFSLMEMMVVLLIVSIVAAATAPMVSKKMTTPASKVCNWVKDGNRIGYNLNDNKGHTVNIGGWAPNDASGKRAPLYIYRDNDTSSSTSHIALGAKNEDGDLHMALINAGEKSLSFNFEDSNMAKIAAGKSSVQIGHTKPYYSGANYNSSVIIAPELPEDDTDYSTRKQAQANSYSVVIGAGAWGENIESVAIGHKVTVKDAGAVGIGSNSISRQGVSIGSKAKSGSVGTVTIGNLAKTDYEIDLDNLGKAQKAIAVGHSSIAFGKQSIAIGANAGVSVHHDENGKLIIPSNPANYSIAIGDNALIQANKTYPICSNNAIAIGHYAGVYSHNKDAREAIAIGFNAKTGIERKYNHNNSNAQYVWDQPDNEYSSSDEGIRYLNLFKTRIKDTYKYDSNGAVAIGSHSTANSKSAIAIGKFAYVKNESESAIALGSKSTASASNSTAIGPGATASSSNSTAIGANATTTATHQIALGTSSDTVYIKGNLVVDGNVELGKNNKSYVMLRARTKNDVEEKDNRFQYVWHKDGAYLRLQDYAPTTSDRRLKNVGEVFKGGLEEIKKLEVFNYTFKKDKDKTPRVGVIAQDLQKIFPNAVFKGDDGFLRIRMEDMFFALVNAVKELDMKIFNHDKEIEALKKENQELKKSVEALEKRLSKLEKLNK